MELRYRLTFKRGMKTLAVVEGEPSKTVAETLTIAEAVEKVLETEQFVEKLTGIRLHIEQVN